jgi:hypothetical protein
VLLILAVGAGVVAFMLLGRKPPRLDRVAVLVAVETLDGKRGAWWDGGDRASARFAETLVKPLEKEGLSVVATADAEATKALSGATSDEALREAARALEAGIIVTGTLKVVRSRPLAGSEMTEYTIEARLAASESAPDGATVPVSEAPIELNVPAASEDRALLQAAEDLPALAQTGIASALVQLPAVARLQGEAATLASDELALASKYEPLVRAARFRKEELDRRAEEERAAAEADTKGERGALKKSLLGAYFAEEYLVGPAADGRLVVLAEPHHVDVLATAGAYELRRGDERLLLVDPATGARTVLAEMYNVFSFPDVSADGRSVAAVVDHRQWSKSLELIAVPDGASKQLLAHASEYYSGPSVAPDGSRVIFWHRECRRCPSSLDVILADGSGQRTLIPADEDGSRSVPRWSKDGRTLYLSIRPQGDPASIWAISVDSGERKAVLGVDAPQPEPDVVAEPSEGVELANEPSGYEDPMVAPDGSFLVALERTDEGTHLGRLDLATGTWRRLASLPAQNVEIAPDGSRIAFETWRTNELEQQGYRGDTEVALVPADGGEVRLLTSNDQDDTLAAWSPDGKRVYFHQQSKDPTGKRYTNRIWWVEP